MLELKSSFVPLTSRSSRQGRITMRYPWSIIIEPSWWRSISSRYRDILAPSMLPLRETITQEFSRALREGGEESLREFVKKHSPDEVQLELAVREGVAADSILSFAQERKMDLIVMGTHGRRGLDRLVLGSVTDRVMRTAPCPVLAISQLSRDSSATGEERRRVHHVSRILFCTDFSGASELPLNYAISATAEYGAELTLLHVLEEVRGPAETDEAIAAAAQQLDKLIPQEGRKTFKIKTAVHMGKPYIANHSICRGSANRHGDHGSEWLGCIGSSGVWFDYPSSDAGGTVPRSRRPRLNRWAQGVLRHR